MSRTHNELAGITITITPRDINNDPYTPTTVRYRLEDCISGKVLIDWTTITPSTSMDVEIAGNLNAIVDNSLKTPEAKVFTVNTDNGLSTQHFEQYIYYIKNLGYAQVA